jgi:hypothetical protein
MSIRSSKKIYVHFQGDEERVHVLRDLNETLTVGQVCRLFARSWNNNHDDKLDEESLVASTAKGRQLTWNQTIDKVLEKEADVYIAKRKKTDCSAAPLNSLRGRSTDTSETSRGPQGLDVCSSLRGRSNGRIASQSPLIKPLLQKAAEREASQHYKAAAFIYNQV